MGGYDSESDIDDQDFTETDVLLGYAQKEAGADAITHLGGTPVSFLFLQHQTL